MQEETRYKIALKATTVSIVCNTLLAFAKILIGIFGFSNALLADGVHSLGDLASDIFVIIAAKIGNQVPDQDHPYGHKRIETIGVIIISLILIAAALGIVYDAAKHLLHVTTLPPPALSTALIAALSLAINEGLYWYTLFYSKKTQSNLLKSNAWHHRVDAWTSAVVLISVIGGYFGFKYLDPIGAFIISLWILKISFSMIYAAGQELIDSSVDKDTLEKIKNYICAVPGVIAIHQLRTRLHSGQILVDLHIQVMPHISVSEGHYISEKVHLGLKYFMPEIADVTVHIDPENDAYAQPSLDLPSRKNIEDTLKNLDFYSKIKKINVHYLNGTLQLELFIPQNIINQDPPTAIAQSCQTALKNVSLTAIKVYIDPTA